MEYTVQKLAVLAGVSARTLRYYDEIGILKPPRKNSSDYRIYGQIEVDKLQQILFYRELGLELDHIKKIINDPGFDASTALKTHREQLLRKRDQLDLLITNVEKTISAAERKSPMADSEKFEGFKQKLIDDNEKQYGEEIREKYGKDTVNASNAKMMNMTEEQFAAFTRTEKQLQKTLAEAFRTRDPGSDKAQQAAALHKQWLEFTWANYSKDAHACTDVRG